MPRIDISDPEFVYDPEDPDGFRAGMLRTGPGLGAQSAGASLYLLPPGQALCPYHYEYGEEEWALVLPTCQRATGERTPAAAPAQPASAGFTSSGGGAPGGGESAGCLRSVAAASAFPSAEHGSSPTRLEMCCVAV